MTNLQLVALIFGMLAAANLVDKNARMFAMWYTMSMIAVAIQVTKDVMS